MPRPRACKNRTVQDAGKKVSRTAQRSGAGAVNKKSLRIRMKETKSGRRMRLKQLEELSRANAERNKKINRFVWPRTVEVAKDPFLSETGVNKLHFCIAINLFPESKILVPSDSESEDEQELPVGNESPDFGSQDLSFEATPDISPSPEPVRRRGRKPNNMNGKRERNSSGKMEDRVWLPNGNPVRKTRGPYAVRGSRNGVVGPIPLTRGHLRIADEVAVLEAINCVVERFQTRYKMPVKPAYGPEELARIKEIRELAANTCTEGSIERKLDSLPTSGSGSGDEEISEPIEVTLDLD